ncbi:MAG: cohesin domain-containing protein [Tepidisphaeraceae bacterium]
MLATHPLTDIPALNSDPTAYAQLYLNFVGAPAHRWAAYSVPVTPAYDQDGDPSTFSDGELTSIREIWARVAEMYSPFNINVTTVVPSDFNPQHALEITIGGNGSWVGGGESGGISYIGNFYNGLPSESFVFPANLANGTPKYVADSAAHEAGHAFGLVHQSVYSGTMKTAEYNEGNSQVAPIMGEAYYSARGLWWYGPSSNGPTSMQDDLAIISAISVSNNNNFGYRPDDHGNTPATASPFAVAGNTLSGSGVIETCPWTNGPGSSVISDKDYFSFTTPAGTVNFTVNVAQYGPMLNAIVELHNASDQIIATGTGTGLCKTLSATVAAGTYYLVVRGDNTYGDLGQYAISGTIPVAPVANAGGPYTVAEGGSVVLNGSASTGTSLTCAWDLNGNGIFGETGAAATWGDETTTTPTFRGVETGTYTISLQVTDASNNTSTATTTVTVTNVPPSPIITGVPAGNSSPEETPINLGVNPNDPGILDTFTYAWTVTRSGTVFASSTAGNFSFTPDVPGAYNVQVVVTDKDGGVGSALASITATHVSYRVVGFTSTVSGFDVQMIRPADLSLLNLYTTESAAQSPDVTLVGVTVGSVQGSLVWDSATNMAHFVKTGGPLLPDVYTATLASRPDGWVDTRGEQLDGDGDGNPGGDYVASFTVAAPSARIVSLGDFARGPGQTVNLPATGTGLPIQISDGTGVSSVQLTLTYDASLLTIDGVTGPAGWSVDTTGSTPGQLVVSAAGPTLADGVTSLLTLDAAVPSSARYGASELLRISGLQVNGEAIAATADDAVHKVAFLGDATGDRSYSALDAADISRVVAGLDTGFAAYPLTDPVIVGDVTGDGTLLGLDATEVAREAVLLPVPQIPGVPPDNVPVQPAGGIDPVIAVGTGIGAPGDVVNVPVSITSATSLQGADLAVSYDTSLLGLSDTDVTLGSVPAGWTLVQNVDNSTGIARMSLFDADPLVAGAGSLVDLKFQIAEAAPDTSSPLSLITTPATASRLNEGQLPLTSVPGAVVIDAGRPALDVGSAVVSQVTSGSFGTISIEVGGRLSVAAGGANLLEIASLVINPGGILDLTDNDLVLTNSDATSFATICQYLSDGRIITSVSEPEPGHFATLAPVDNQLLHLQAWNGTTINDGTNFSQVIIKHTWFGDTNLDGMVTAADYVNVIADQGQPGQWILGDLNGDGMVTPDDLAVVSSNLGAGLPAGAGPQLLANPAVAAAAAKTIPEAVPKAATKTPIVAGAKKKPAASGKGHVVPVTHHIQKPASRRRAPRE